MTLCHIPPGNPANARTITVGFSAVAALPAHGDYLEECEAGGDGDDNDGDDGEDATDADGDGVSDDADQCAGMPADEVADTAGYSCSQRDGDADGVNDRDDACPNTAMGTDVDDTGCAAVDLDDDDGDGVSNGMDDSPALRRARM